MPFYFYFIVFIFLISVFSVSLRTLPKVSIPVKYFACRFYSCPFNLSPCLSYILFLIYWVLLAHDPYSAIFLDISLMSYSTLTLFLLPWKWAGLLILKWSRSNIKFIPFQSLPFFFWMSQSPMLANNIFYLGDLQSHASSRLWQEIFISVDHFSNAPFMFGLLLLFSC